MEREEQVQRSRGRREPLGEEEGLLGVGKGFQLHDLVSVCETGQGV